MEFSDKKCFIVTPIGNENSDTRRAAEGVIDAVIVPVLTSIGFKEEHITVAHRMPQPGSINKQVVQRILEDDLVIANLSNLNANVMYELAVRHCSRKPVIQICEDNGTKLPFDIIEERTIFYKNDMLGTVQLGDNLRRMVPEALSDTKVDNPIYRVIESNIIQNSENIKDSDKYMISRLNDIELSIAKLLRNDILSDRNQQKERKVFMVDKHFWIYIKSTEFSFMDFRDRLKDVLDEKKYVSDVGIRLSNDDSEKLVYLDFKGNKEIEANDVEKLIKLSNPNLKVVVDEMPF